LDCHSKTRTGMRPRRSASLAALKLRANVKIETTSATIDNARVMCSIINCQRGVSMPQNITGDLMTKAW
jgi:hypothetical protein